MRRKSGFAGFFKIFHAINKRPFHWRLAQNKWPPQNLHPLPVNNERSLISIFHKTFSVQIMFFLRRRSSVSNNVFMSVNIFFSIAFDILSVCKQNALSKLDCILRVVCSKCQRNFGGTG